MTGMALAFLFAPVGLVAEWIYPGKGTAAMDWVWRHLPRSVRAEALK